MFGPRGNKAVRRGSREGPMPVPKDEPLHLRSLEEQSDTALATRSLLSLRTARVESDLDNVAAKSNNHPSTFDARGGQMGADSANYNDDDDRKLPAQPSYAVANRNVATANLAQAHHQSLLNSQYLGLALEYAAGVALRTHVLDPVIREFPDSSEAEATRFLGIYSRGEFLLLNTRDGIRQGSIERIGKDDGLTMAHWWDGDKFLSYTDRPWSDWWIQRCNMFDPGCEMMKLIDDRGETSGVVYFERNVVDRHQFGDNGRVTLIRGIRISPSLNPEVLQRRGDLTGKHSSHGGELYQVISSLLFYHVLFMSVRYGTNAVGVNCPKYEVSERFYESLMDKPVAFDESSGRRYYRISQETRWEILRKAFRQQVGLWLQQLNKSGKNGVSSHAA